VVCEIEVVVEIPLGEVREEHNTDSGEEKNVRGTCKEVVRYALGLRDRPYRCKFGQGMRRIRTTGNNVLRR
jgi:hypothetical protein